MKKLVLMSFAAASVCAFAIPSHADPTQPPIGRKCGFNSTTDVTREAGWQTGDINGGPLTPTVPGTLVCRVVVNGGLHSTASPSGVGVNASASAHTDALGVATIPPTVLNYPATAADEISLCASFVPDAGFGPAQYWVSENPTPSNTFSTGHWSTNVNDSCGVALSIEPNDPECSIWLAIDQRLGTNIAEIWQDCEPYDPII